ncbi:MAG: DUF2283 domain-containing protein, partial [Deltaproteobacteria bacterium]|nr:DUF2283 domain-containing protein [Deltaproteobacteria bacterium]
MRITYDAEADALYVRFRECAVNTTELPEGLSLDMDAEGHLVG